MAGIKTAEEIELLKRAAKAVEEVFARALPFIKPGITEKRLAEIMKEFAFEIPGVEDLAYETIVASGPNGAKPHAELTDREILTGDMVTIDFGVKFGGYSSDITRTFLPAEPTEKQKKIFDSVLRAQEAGLKAARAGLECAALDAVCRGLIEKDGFAEYFIHTTGHGVGTEVHEDPRISAKSDEVLQAGMVVTIEPGIYIEGFGGVRIEDMVLITETGCEVITNGIEKNLYFKIS